MSMSFMFLISFFHFFRFRFEGDIFDDEQQSERLDFGEPHYDEAREEVRFGITLELLIVCSMFCRTCFHRSV